MRRLLFSLLFGSICGTIYFILVTYPDLIPQVTPLINTIALCPIRGYIEQGANTYLPEFSSTTYGQSTICGLQFFFIVWILLLVIGGVWGFFKDLFAFFPLKPKET